MTVPDFYEPFQQQVIDCRKCPRLVEWREQVAVEKVKRFADEPYWGKAVPSFGDPNARLLIVGLAPAAHGANRTGRMFTGDRSGDWLYRALHKAGFASQPNSTAVDDKLTLKDCYITATVRCAPPQNKPTKEETDACHGYLETEWQQMPNVKVVVALGKIAFDRVIKVSCIKNPKGGKGHGIPNTPKPVFGHLSEDILPGVPPVLMDRHLIGSYHPSQQNTFTGRLTEEMLDAVFNRVNELLTD
ncbi:MAG: uracil-DNA glycosylase [Vampirovibrio sp.]|nr:uracil-DNA glycosylase [Vampirovibrio sp.]